MTTTVQETTKVRERNELRMDVRFFQVPNAIFDLENDLTPVQKLVWIYICRRGNQGTTAFPSYRRIAKDCNLGRRTAMRAVQVLVEKNWLEKTTRHHGEYSTNIYQVKIRGGVTESPPSATESPPSATESPKEEPLKKNHLGRTSEEEDGEGDNHHHSAADILTFFRENINIRVTPVIERELRDLVEVEDFSLDWVKEAITEAARHRVSSPVPYIRTVLENKRDGKGKEKGSGEEKERKPTFKHAANVFLTEKEVLKLVEKFGKPGAEARIDFLSLSKESSGKKYASDYATILLFQRRGNPDGTEWDPEPPDWEIRQEWLDTLQKPAQGKRTASELITLAEWFKLWSEDYLKDATVGGQSFYRETFVNYILPELGAIPLREITRPHVRQLLDKVPTGQYPGRRRIRSALQECLVGAINKGLLDTNPASLHEYVDSVCKWCGRTFRAQKPEDGGPPSDHCNRNECVDKDREEWKRASAAPAPSKAPIGSASDEVTINGGIRKAASFDQLTAKEKRALELRFGLKDGQCHTCPAAAKELDVCASRVRELEVNALSKLYGDRLSLDEQRQRFAEEYSRRPCEKDY